MLSTAVCFTLFTPSLAVTMPTLDTTIGCNKGASYIKSATYGVSSSRWGHLPRGGWRGAVRVNDKIYGIPCNATSVRIFSNPLTRSCSFPNAQHFSRLRHLPLHMLGQVLEIDPASRSVSTFGSLGLSLTDVQCSGSVHCGDEKWIGGVHVPGTGKIIAIPYAAETVLEIDTEKRTTSTFGIVSSSVKRKWVDGVMGRNGLIYAIPYDADVVLEIDPETHALMLFGRVGGDPCKWYGGVLAPNGKIYTIPYASPYVLEIDTERRIARPFAMTYPHWAKWSGGVLAPNGKIYGIPALSKSVLEIDVEKEQTSLYGMLPGGNDLQDKWGGGVLAPNGKIYGLPWRSASVLEFDPTNKAISLLGQGIGSSNFSWSGGVLANDGRIVAVPYNGAWVLEIGESVCSVAATKKEILPPLSLEHLSSAALTAAPGAINFSPVAGAPRATTTNAAMPTSRPVSIQGAIMAPGADVKTASGTPVIATDALALSPTIPSVYATGMSAGAGRTFVLALLGCPDESKAAEDACFHLSHRTWHSAMATIMQSDSSLHDIRAQVQASRLSHVPINFCFLFNGHALDPNVEDSIKAATVAIVTAAPDTRDPQYVILIDNVHCNIGPQTLYSSLAIGTPPGSGWLFLVSVFLFGTLAGVLFLVHRGGSNAHNKGTPQFVHYKYDRMPAGEVQEAQPLMDSEAVSDKKDTPDQPRQRIPCFPHARSVSLHLRPVVKPSRLSPRLCDETVTTIETGITKK